MSNSYTDKTYYGGTFDLENMKTYQTTNEENSSSVAIGTNIDGYHILEEISSAGNESIVYKVIKAGELYALKFYKRLFKASVTRLELLKKIDSPYVAKLIDYNYYDNHLYEIYNFYENGTLLDKGLIDNKTLKKYVYQLNEGLYALHNVSNSIMLIHGDLKPSNIFISNDGESVIIGDFGISMLVEEDSFGIGEIAGTPEFSPPSFGVLDKVRRTPSFDYGSLGLVVYFMSRGYSKFSGMNTAEIAKEWSDGIKFDEIIDTRLRMLLSGLLVSDESKRFGYEKVKEWYEGSFVTEVSPKSIFNKKETDEKGSLWFGIFDNESITVTSIKELVTQMKKHWEQAAYKLRDANFYEFLYKFSLTRDKIAIIRNFVSEGDIDAAVFKTLYLLSDDAEIIYKGNNFGNAENFMSILSSGESELAEELIVKGLFSYYLQQMGYSENDRRAIDDILNLKNCPDRFKLYTLTYFFSKDKKYKNYETLNALRSDICEMSVTEIGVIANDLKFMAWLYSLGFKDEALTMLNSRGE